MAELHDLKPAAGSHRGRKRLGRGNASGKGHKGQKARSGGKVHPRFEGGQMPLIRRIPKRGFKSLDRVEYQVVNVRDLARVEGGDVSPESLKAAGLIGSLRRPVKVLGEGDAPGKLKVSAHRFSKSAQEKIEAAGGSVSVIAVESSEE